MLKDLTSDPFHSPAAALGLHASTHKVSPAYPQSGRAMTFEPEVLFIDPAVADIPAILAGLRAGVQPVLLDAARPAAAQMAAALAGRQGLAAVHIIAHGAPGRVAFAAGEWSRETLARDAGDLAAIGRALAEDGDLRLWSCETGRGAAGEAFVEGLEDATGVYVGAAHALVGAASLGGQWELAGGQTAPLTTAGVASYSGILSVEVTLNGTLDTGVSATTAFAVEYYVTTSTGVIVASFSLPSEAISPFTSVAIILNVPSTGVATTYTITALVPQSGNNSNQDFTQVAAGSQ